ncbi:MAG TPA: hypothetical protein VE404_00180, partial [Verrucomicrobiae bacterium]|nr:hypothetical protein [Verrucomicrobiae bacterium]
STLLLVPIVALLLARRAASSEAWPLGRGGARALETRRARALAAAALFGAALLVSGLVVWASYGFRYSAAADPAEAARMESQVFGPQGDAGGSAPGPPREAGHFPLERIVRRTAALGALLNRYPDGPPDDVVDREMAAAPIGAAGASILFAARHRLLPEAYLFGLSYARMKSLQRASFLNGDLSSRGFRSYLPWAFLLKTPLLTLALLAGAALLALARRSSRRGDLAFLVVPVAVYFLASLASNLNIGHRHLLPIYPFLFVLCGLLGREWAALARVPAAATAALVLSGIALGGFVVFAPPWSPEVVYPHYLAYFNELAGGPRDGYRHLVDSNLDWGQDLKGLHEWAVRHGIDANNPLYLCYFGMADPRFYGIPHVNLPGGYPLAPQARVEALPPGAFLAVSATNLQGVYFSPPVRDTWRSILAHSTLVDTIGYSIFVYRIGPPAS